MGCIISTPPLKTRLILGLSCSGKTTLLANAGIVRPRDIDITSDLFKLARHAILYDGCNKIVHDFLEQPGAFDSERLRTLFYCDIMQFVWKGRNALKGITISNQLFYIIPNLKRLMTTKPTEIDNLYGYHPTMPPFSKQRKGIQYIESREIVDAIDPEVVHFVVSLLDYYQISEDHFTPRLALAINLFENAKKQYKRVEVIFTHVDMFRLFMWMIPYRTSYRNTSFKGAQPTDSLRNLPENSDVMFDCILQHFQAYFPGAASYSVIDAIECEMSL